MKLFASILLILSLASFAAARTYTAYSVSGVQRTLTTDVYTATVNTVKVPDNKDSKAPIPSNGSAIIITTNGCKHVPGKDGENGIVLNGPLGFSLLFSSGETCTVISAFSN